jgi:hypothetical protein
VAGDSDALAEALRKNGFLVGKEHDATQAKMADAIARLKARVRPGAVVLIYFGGFGVQSRDENYMMPIDAKIWTEADIRRDGAGVERLLSDLEIAGARTRLAVIDASGRNPYGAADQLAVWPERASFLRRSISLGPDSSLAGRRLLCATGSKSGRELQ